MEHSWRKTYTHKRHTPTNDALSILKKLEQLNQSMSFKSEEAFEEHHRLNYCSRTVCVCLSCACKHFICMYCIEGKRALCKNNITFPFIPSGLVKLCQSVNQILPQMQFSTSRETERGRVKQAVLLDGSELETASLHMFHIMKNMLINLLYLILYFLPLFKCALKSISSKEPQATHLNYIYIYDTALQHIQCLTTISTLYRKMPKVCWFQTPKCI